MEAEWLILSAVLSDDICERTRELSALLPDHFTDPTTGAIWRACRDLVADRRDVNLIEISERAGVGLLVIQPMLDGNRHGQWTSSAMGVIGEAWAKRAQATLLDNNLQGKLTALECQRGFEAITEKLDELGGDGVRAKIEAARIRMDVEPPRVRTVFTVGGVCVATPGNIGAVIAAAKAGKTAFIGAAIGSTFSERPGLDFLGVAGFNAKELAVVHLDSEQAMADHRLVIGTAMRRAAIGAAPPWLHSYSTVGWSAGDRRSALPHMLAKAKREHGGLHAVFIDGVADMVNDPNDGKEVFPFVDSLQALALKFDCPIIGVLHLNPGSEKSRGHLGSQLERRAETNLVLEKDAESGRTVVYSNKQRRAPILKLDGPCFRWDEQAGMHVSVRAIRAERDEREHEGLAEITRESYADRAPGGMRYGELVQAVQKAARCSERTAQDRVKEMKHLNMIRENPPKLWDINI